MNLKSYRLCGTALVLCLLSIMWNRSFAQSGSNSFCIPRSQTRTACEDHTGQCQITAWNYKIYYTRNYECCYNQYGQYTHKNSTGQSGPTSAIEGDCCQDLETVTFTDGHWSLPCEPTATPPITPPNN